MRASQGIGVIPEKELNSNKNFTEYIDIFKLKFLNLS